MELSSVVAELSSVVAELVVEVLELVELESSPLQATMLTAMTSARARAITELSTFFIGNFPFVIIGLGAACRSLIGTTASYPIDVTISIRIFYNSFNSQ